MSGASEPGADPASRPGANPWTITLLVALATFMEVLDTTIANVALPYIGGGMGVSEDEASWVVTTYLVSNAVILTASPFFSRMFGRKTFFQICLALFTLSSIGCGLAPNLQTLLLFRILQGVGGGGMVPVSQAIVASSFPPEKVGQGFAVWGIAVIVAPVVGPTLGGWLSDNWSWHWCFLINAPVGLLSFVLISALLQEPDDRRRTSETRSSGFDVIGFLLVATFLGALELALDRGLNDDWFSSGFIVGVASISAIAFAAMIPWETSRRDPMIDLKVVATRQFGACMVVMTALGAILLSTTQFMPQVVQQEYGYTATWAGLMLSPGGLVTMIMMPIAGRLSALVQPRYLIAAGAAACALSMYQLTSLTPGLDFWYFAAARALMNVGIPLIFIPITVAAYQGLPKTKTDQASALISAARNVGGSLGISFANNVFAHRQQFHQSRLVEHAIPSSATYQDTLQRVVDFFVGKGASALEAQQRAVAWIGQQIQTQATFLAYVDVFWTLMLVSLAAIPFALVLRRVKLGEAAHGGH